MARGGWDQQAWERWYARGAPDDDTRPDRRAKPPMPGEVDSRLLQQSPQVVPRHPIPAGFSLNEKPRPKPGEVDAILKKLGVRP